MVDYTLSNWSESPHRYDVILGVAGYQSLRTYARSLAPDGTYVAIGGKNAQIFECLFVGPVLSLFSHKDLRALVFSPRRDELEFLAALVKARQLRPVIDRYFPLPNVPEALGYVEKGHARGKVIIQVSSPVTAC